MGHYCSIALFGWTGYLRETATFCCLYLVFPVLCVPPIYILIKTKAKAKQLFI
jgi:hypothetical protein